MARETFEDWIPIENGDSAIQALNRGSFTERVARPERMGSDTKWVPRSGNFAVAAVGKGAAYTETSGVNDYVELIARKAGGVVRVAEEDLIDSPADILGTKKVDALRSLGTFFDNATLATSAAQNGTTVLYDSVYRRVRTADANVGYTANANYVSGSATYANLSNTFGTVEDSIWFDESQLFVAASPAFRAVLRNIVDLQGRPIFVERQGMGDGTTPDTIFGQPISWTMGARVSGTNTQAPTGFPLMIVGNRDLLIKGMAKLSPAMASPNPGFALQRANNGIGFLTDEALMKAAMRRAFAVGAPNAFAVFEKTL
jgi:hypothetical protein